MYLLWASLLYPYDGRLLWGGWLNNLATSAVRLATAQRLHWQLPIPACFVQPLPWFFLGHVTAKLLSRSCCTSPRLDLPEKHIVWLLPLELLTWQRFPSADLVKVSWNQLIALRPIVCRWSHEPCTLRTQCKVLILVFSLRQFGTSSTSSFSSTWIFF